MDCAETTCAGKPRCSALTCGSQSSRVRLRRKKGCVVCLLAMQAVDLASGPGASVLLEPCGPRMLGTARTAGTAGCTGGTAGAATGGSSGAAQPALNVFAMPHECNFTGQRFDLSLVGPEAYLGQGLGKQCCCAANAHRRLTKPQEDCGGPKTD